MSDQVYVRIAESIDKGIQTALKADGELSKAFIAFLKIVYSPEEAELVQHLDMMKSKTIEEIIDASGMAPGKVNEIIDRLSKRAAVEGRYKKRLPGIPTLLNLHMFYPEIKDDDLEAAKEVITLAQNGGMGAYYAGKLTNSITVEGLTSLLIVMNKHYKIKSASIGITGISDS